MTEQPLSTKKLIWPLQAAYCLLHVHCTSERSFIVWPIISFGYVAMMTMIGAKLNMSLHSKAISLLRVLNTFWRNLYSCWVSRLQGHTTHCQALHVELRPLMQYDRFPKEIFPTLFLFFCRFDKGREPLVIVREATLDCPGNNWNLAQFLHACLGLSC